MGVIHIFVAVSEKHIHLLITDYIWNTVILNYKFKFTFYESVKNLFICGFGCNFDVMWWKFNESRF